MTKAEEQLRKRRLAERAKLRRLGIHVSAATKKERANLPRAAEQLAYESLVHGASPSKRAPANTAPTRSARDRDVLRVRDRQSQEATQGVRRRQR